MSRASGHRIQNFVKGLGHATEMALESLRRLADDRIVLCLDARYLSLAVASTVLPKPERGRPPKEVLAAPHGTNFSSQGCGGRGSPGAGERR
jgi:hypothetical protein